MRSCRQKITENWQYRRRRNARQKMRKISKNGEERYTGTASNYLIKPQKNDIW